MASIKSYRDLHVWQEAMELAELCYKLTSGFPSREVYVLVSQIRRAVISVAANIAEGHNRRSLVTYLNHLSIALGSEAEVETQIELSRRLGYLKDSEAKLILDLGGRVGRRLHALIGSLEKGPASHPGRDHPRVLAHDAQNTVPTTQHPEPDDSVPIPSTQHPAPSTPLAAPRRR